MELNFSKTIAKCGSPLWTLSLPSSKTIAAGILVNAGSREEIWPKEAGIAHALEHMHLQGTENFPTQHKFAEYIEETGGTINAWTSKEMTFYYSHLPIAYKERVIRVISEQLNKSLLLEEKIKTEMQNIVQEIRRAYDNHQGYIEQRSYEFIYKDHPLSKEVLGLEKSVLSFSKDDFISYKKRCYNSANYVFIVAGNIEQKEALNLIDKYFQAENKPQREARKPQKIKSRDNHILIERRDIKQAHLFLNFVAGKAEEKESVHLEIFKDMIRGGMSFPLFQKVRNELGLCYEIWAQFRKWSDAGLFNIYIGADLRRCQEAINATLDVIEKSKSDKSLLEKVKKFKIGRLTINYENAKDIINIAARDIAAVGKPKGYEEIIKEIEEVDIKDIENAVNKYLKPELLYTCILAPNNFTL